MEINERSIGFTRKPRDGWTGIVDEEQAALIAEKRRQRNQVMQTWRQETAGQDIEELRAQQAKRAARALANDKGIAIGKLYARCSDDPDFLGEASHALLKTIYFANGDVQPGFTGLFDTCTRSQTEDYLRAAMQQLQDEG